jgi:hypothetical protein
LQAIPTPSQIKPKKPGFEGRRGRGRFGFFRSTLGLSYNLNPPLFAFCLLNGFVFGVFVHHVHRPKKGASAHRPGIEIDLELGEGPHGLRDMGHETTREIKCAREQERKRSDGSGYTATSTATLRSPLKQQIKQFSWHSAHFFSLPAALLLVSHNPATLAARAAAAADNGGGGGGGGSGGVVAEAESNQIAASPSCNSFHGQRW